MVKKSVHFDVTLKTSDRTPSHSFKMKQKVMTNDKNSVEITFRATDVSPSELTGATASVMLYMQDGSFFQSNDVTVANNVLKYTMKPNETKHKGLTKVQLVVISGTIDNASLLQEFEIIAGLEQHPITEVMIQDWTTLTAEAKAFVDQIEGFTLESFVENKMGQELANLEVNYATRLTGLESNDASLTAQLAQKASNERVDQIIATPLSGVSAEEINDARGSHRVLGERLNYMEINTDVYRLSDNKVIELTDTTDVPLGNTRTGTLNFTLKPTVDTLVKTESLEDRYVDSFLIKDDKGSILTSQNIKQHLDKLSTFEDSVELNLYTFAIKKKTKRINLKDLTFTLKNDNLVTGYIQFNGSIISDIYQDNSTGISSHTICDDLPIITYTNAANANATTQGIGIYNQNLVARISATTIGALAEDDSATKIQKFVNYLTTNNTQLLYGLATESVTEITNDSFILPVTNTKLMVAIAKFNATLNINVPLLMSIEFLKEDLQLDVPKGRLQGKKIVCFGDSITDSSNYPELIASQTGATVYNVGFGGCMYQEHPRADYDAFGMHALATAISTGDWSYQDTGVQTVEPNFQPHLDTLKSIDFNTVDIITIQYGTNDWRNGLLIGEPSIDNVDKTNLNGAINKSIQALLTAYPKLRIMLLSPPWRMLDYETEPRGSDVTLRGNPSRHLYNDVSMAIKDRAFDYKVAFFDLYKECGWNWMTKDLYTTDGTHPTAEGSKILAEKIASKLVSTF